MPPHLTNRELDVMAVLWERESATVAEVLDALPAELAYTTVLTVLRGLEAKGHVRHESEGKAFRYYPTVEPAKAGEKVLFSKYGGTEVKIEGEDYLIMREDDILGVVE